MLLLEFFFLLCLAVVDSQRYYAFVETLFVIDTAFFPQPSLISYDDYVRTIVDTSNIIFQSQNDLDVKIEIIVSNIVYSSIAEQQSQEPTAYASKLQATVSDYDRYDSIVLLWYQPWEGPHGAQGYAMLSGVCDPKHKMMYLIPHQNAAFYLAHELGHQLGLQHQIDTPCFTSSYMSVMTRSHTVSYEQARWSRCENDWINEHICNFPCLFNQPDNYQPIKNKYSTLPGQRMNNEQQARMIEQNDKALGESSSLSFMPSDTPSRCLYLRYYTGPEKAGYIFAFTPMLPGSDCGSNSICYLDQCVPRDAIDSSLFSAEKDNGILNLNAHCSSGHQTHALKASNRDPRSQLKCINMENDFLCAPSRECPKGNDESVAGLYTRYICCEKCSPKPDAIMALFSRAHLNGVSSVLMSVVLSQLILQLI